MPNAVCPYHALSLELRARSCCCNVFPPSLGSKTEIARLQSLVPQYRDLRVTLGRWKPLLTSDDPAERIPPAAMLLKAAVWRDPQFDLVRKNPLLTDDED